MQVFLLLTKLTSSNKAKGYFFSIHASIASDTQIIILSLPYENIFCFKNYFLLHPF